MRYFLIGLTVLIIIAVILYFVLSRFYDYLSYRSAVSDEKRETRLQKYEDNLEKIRLEEKRDRLIHTINIRSRNFQPQQEISQLAQELEEVNELIRTIERQES